MGKELNLKKNIGFFVSTSLVIGTVIGSGIFMKPGIVLSSTANSTMALLAWIIGGVITLASGLTIAEVSVKIPRTGGLYAYIEEVYGEKWGFLCGWVQTIVYGPAVMGALSLYFGSLLADFFGFQGSSKLIGIITIILLGGLNILGTQLGGFIQTISTAGKLVPIILIAVFGILQGDVSVFNAESGSSTHAISMGAAVLATLWAYDGWMNVGFMAGEMKNPSKTLPRAIISGIVIVILAYLSVNIAMLHVLSASKIVELGPNAATAAASSLFGNIGGKILAIGILVSIFGCLNGKILTFPRVTFAMAERNFLPGSKVLSSIHPKFNTPVGSTIFQIVLALAMMIFWNPDRLSDMAIFAVFLFYGLAFNAIFILRKKDKGGNKLYKVPLYPITPIVAIIGTLYIIGSTIINAPLDALVSIGIAIVGLPVYWKLKSTITSDEKYKAS